MLWDIISKMSAHYNPTNHNAPSYQHFREPHNPVLRKFSSTYFIFPPEHEIYDLGEYIEGDTTNYV